MHDLCIFHICFCSKIIFDQKFFSLCWHKLDYPGSIAYLSCSFINFEYVLSLAFVNFKMSFVIHGFIFCLQWSWNLETEKYYREYVNKPLQPKIWCTIKTLYNPESPSPCFCMLYVTPSGFYLVYIYYYFLNYYYYFQAQRLLFGSSIIWILYIYYIYLFIWIYVMLY